MITKDQDLARQALISNDIVAIPTETVYGLAGNAFSEEAIGKVFALKQRPLYNPLIVHIKSAQYLEVVASEVPAKAQQLADAFWPGPLTLVLKKKSIIPDIVTAGKDTVAVRVPNHPITLKLLNQLSFPVAAPSANPFGSISPTTADHVYSYFGEELSLVLDGGECERGIESTIVGFEDNEAILYRLGSLSVEDIENTIGPLKVNTLDDKAPKAPGMLSRHYAPDTDTYLTDDVRALISANEDKKIGLLLFKNEIPDESDTPQEILSAKGDLIEAASQLYAAMHRLDKLDLDMIIAERLPDVGLGKTLNDKLTRATK